MDLTGPGILAAVVMVCLGLVELLKHFVLKRNGNGIKAMVCPNKVEGLKEAMDSIKDSMKDTAEIVKHNQEGIDDLVEDHAATPEGVKTWKFQGRHVQLWEKSVSQQQVMTACLSRITASTEEMVELQRETIAILKTNGGKA